MSRVIKASLLFLFLSVCGSSFLVAHKLREHIPAPAPRELFAVVNEQLSAIRVADFGGAYRHAAAGVQQRFTPSQFEKMMRRKCPNFAMAQRVEFGTVEVRGDTAQVEVFLIGGDGLVRSFVYSLTREDETWRIDGMEELPGCPMRAHLGGTQA